MLNHGVDVTIAQNKKAKRDHHRVAHVRDGDAVADRGRLQGLAREKHLQQKDVDPHSGAMASLRLPSAEPDLG